MKKFNFSTDQKEKMEIWRQGNISTSEQGFQNGKSYNHIIPKNLWKETIWDGIRLESELPKYLIDNEIQSHTGTHNLVSSWSNCANLYFPIRSNANLKQLMMRFLKQQVSDSIIELEEVELEFAFPKSNELHPAYYWAKWMVVAVPGKPHQMLHLRLKQLMVLVLF